jgi:toxin CptA
MHAGPRAARFGQHLFQVIKTMMQNILASAVFGSAVLLTALMGFAIQRGATCTVAAIDEIVGQRRCARLLGMLEASLWVAGVLLIASTLHLTMLMPPGFAVSWMIVAGGVLLGLGAFINKACVFGAIARLSNGEWAYIATPLGFFAGCALLQVLPIPHQRMTSTSLLFGIAHWVVWLFVAFVLTRIGIALWRMRKAPGYGFTTSIWSPAAATIVIGVAFVLLLLLVGGSWAYTDVLAELSMGKSANLTWRLLLLLALYAGGLLGGYTAGRCRYVRPDGRQVLRCFIGGLLMGLGSLLIPGSNDGLILLGMPLLYVHAWLAFLTMCLTIAIAMKLRSPQAARPQAT